MWYHLSGRPTSRCGYYVCSGRSRRTCHAPFGRADLAEDQAVAVLRQLTVPEAWKEAVAARAAVLLDAQRAKPAADRRVIKQRLERLKLLYLDGDLNDAAYRSERDRLHALLNDSALPVLEPDLQQALELLTNLGQLLEVATPDERRTFIRAIFSHLWVERREIKAITPTKLYLPLIGAIKNAHLANAGCADGAIDPHQSPQ